MQVGTLVSHEGLLEQVGIVTLLVESITCWVYFPRLDKTMPVFIDDLEVIC